MRSEMRDCTTVDSGGEKMVQWTIVPLDNLLGYMGLHRVCKPATNGKSRPTACIFIVHGYHRCVLQRVRRRTFSREFTRLWMKNFVSFSRRSLEMTNRRSVLEQKRLSSRENQPNANIDKSRAHWLSFCFRAGRIMIKRESG